MKKILFAFLALLIASCGGSKKTNTNAVELRGDYQLVSIQGMDVSEKDFSFTFNPAENRITGETGCNGFSASYLQENNVLSIGRAMSTRMYCEGKMETEQNIIAGLEDIAKVKKAGEEFILTSTDNRSLFTLIKTDKSE